MILAFFTPSIAISLLAVFKEEEKLCQLLTAAIRELADATSMWASASSWLTPRMFSAASLVVAHDSTS
jgi:hypothetical protein